MHGIQLFHYKALQHYLKKLKEEGAHEAGCEHSQLVLMHEQRLEDIYSNYQVAMEKVSFIVKEFDEHMQSVRKLVRNHRNCRKQNTMEEKA